ncbi:MAG: LEA type 2 family protein [Proteobacteria bacterium]|nr:LEA type 2 family protein [Pseudomonadota bacterium]
MRNQTPWRLPLLAVMIAGALCFSACAGLSRPDPPHVTVVGMEPAQGEGLEARLLLKLRVQNPNEAPIAYNGIYVELRVLDKSFASGVSSESGTVPAFGETVIGVPVSVSVMGILSQAIGLMGGKSVDRLDYALHGKLNTTTGGAVRFSSQGELALPATAP